MAFGFSKLCKAQMIDSKGNSNRALALAIVNGTSSFGIWKPLHNMMEMPSMLAFGAPHHCFVQSFSFVGRLLLSRILFHLLSIRIVNWNRVQANGTSRKHDHALNAVHDLNPVVLCKVMVAFEFWLFWVDIYLFGQNWINLWGLAVRAVESECFGQVFTLTFNLNCETFFVEFVPRNAPVDFVQQPLVNVNEPAVKGFLLSPQAAYHFGLFWKGF